MPPTVTFNEKISAYSLSLLSDKDLPDIAMTALEEGFDSESLRILAGCGSAENRFKLADLFSRSLEENGITIPAGKISLMNVLRHYAYEIVNDKVDSYEGFQVIEKIVRSTTFEFSDIKLESCYADYISIWEISSDGLQLHEGSGLTREEFIEKEKRQLVLHLRSWLDDAGGT